MEGIKNESDALRACCDEFISEISKECGYHTHHVEVTPRKSSCMCVEIENGRNREVPVLDLCFWDDSYQMITDDRGRLKSDISDKLRSLWQETTIPYRMYLDKKEYCDSKMYVFASDFERKCFYDYITGRQSEILELLEKSLGIRPERLYPAHEGINIVYKTSDYIALELDTKAESLKEEIYSLADRYITDKYQQKIKIVSYIRFLHREMPGYNEYGLWLG